MLAGIVAAPSFAIVGGALERPAVASGVILGESVTDPAVQSARLAAAIDTEIAALPPTATSEDFEASLVYVLSQGDYPASVVMITLQRLAVAQGGPAGLTGAVARVQTALLARKLSRGTAAITGGGFSFVGSGFSAPVTVSGGGSTTYSS